MSGSIKLKNKGYNALTVLLILLFIATSVCAYILTDRFGLKLDLTENRLYTLTDTTHNLVENLSAPVVITVFNTETEFLTLPRELLRRYDRLSSKLSVRYCDPYLQPALVQGYREKGYDVELNSIMVESGELDRYMTLMDLYKMDSSGEKVQGLVAEQMLTSAIAGVTAQRKPLVQFTDGHNEQPSQALLNVFTRNNYELSYTMLSVLGVDPQADTLVIAAPTRDFSKEDTAAVEQYLEQGGSVMVFLEPGSTAFPNLFDLLADWGIGVSDQTVLEPQLYVSASRLNVAATYANHPINQFFADNRYYVISPSSRALLPLYEKRGGVTTQQVLISSSKSYAQTHVESEDSKVPEAYGPFVLAMTSQREVSTQSNSKSARLFVSGSKNIYGDDLLQSSSLANNNFLVRSASWCLEEEPLLDIPDKALDTEYLPILAGEAHLFALILQGILPMAVLIFGAYVYLRRRHL
ncbi:GldG family protein [Oscillospiraceae bacterium LTW-04]|nr:GldG family protein [Oscillospiraceae bacterium MB24-C1]